MSKKIKKISYQGIEGSYSHLAATKICNNCDYIGLATFDEVLDCVLDKKADLAVLPVENSNAGRVSSSYVLIAHKGLYITGEYYLPINHCLIGTNNSTINDIEFVYSHPQALSQSSKFISKMGLKEIPYNDTAFSVKFIVNQNDPKKAAIASEFAAKIYKAKILKRNIANSNKNTTRFLIIEKRPKKCLSNKCKVAIYFEVKNVPASLFKCLSGFATEKINIVKLESFVSSFNGKAEFYLEYEKPSDKKSEKRALEELKFFSKKMNILGEFQAVK